MNLAPDTSIAVMQASQGTLQQTNSDLKKAANNKELERLDVVAKDFEAMFVAEMMKPMFEGIKPNEMFGGGKTEEIFQGIMIQEYGKMMAETGQLGIAQSVKAELIKMQGLNYEPEAEQKNTNPTITTELNSEATNE